MKSNFTILPKSSTVTSVTTGLSKTSLQSVPEELDYVTPPCTPMSKDEIKFPILDQSKYNSTQSASTVGLTNSSTPFGTSSAFAYAGVSEFSGPSVSFAGGMSDHLSIRVRIPLCEVGLPSSGTSAITSSGAFPAFRVSTYSGASSTTTPIVNELITLSPATLIGSISNVSGGGSLWPRPSFADCSVLEILSSSFSKYRMKTDVQLDYMPQSATSDTSAFSLSFADDPAHPINGLGAFQDASNLPGYTTVKNSVNSIVFSCWAPWKLKCHLDTSTIYYTSSEVVKMSAALTDTSTFASLDIGSWFPDLRQCFFGSVMCYANQQNGSAAFSPKGQLYVEFEVEFFDLVPIVPGSSLPFDYMFALNLLASRGDQSIRKISPGKRLAPTPHSASFYKPILSSFHNHVYTEGRKSVKLKKPAGRQRKPKT